MSKARKEVLRPPQCQLKEGDPVPQWAYIYLFSHLFKILAPQLTMTTTVGPWTNHLLSLKLKISICKFGRKTANPYTSEGHYEDT